MDTNSDIKLPNFILQYLTQWTVANPRNALKNISDDEFVEQVNHANANCLAVNLFIPPSQEVMRWFFDSVFKCNGCGKCCTGELASAKKEYVVILPPEVDAIAGHLKMKKRKFTRLYSKSDDGLLYFPCPCPYYENSSKFHCSIYPVRPLTCHYYPLYGVKQMKGAENTSTELTIDAECPEARKSTLQILKAVRDTLNNDM